MPAVAPLVTGLFLLISSPSLLPPGVSIPYSLFSSIIPQSALPAYKSALPGASRSSVVPRNESHLQKGENSPKIISCKWDHLFLLSFSKNETCSPRGYHLSQSAFNNPKSQIPLFVPHSFFSNNEYEKCPRFSQRSLTEWGLGCLHPKVSFFRRACPALLAGCGGSQAEAFRKPATL